MKLELAEISQSQKQQKRRESDLLLPFQGIFSEGGETPEKKENPFMSKQQANFQSLLALSCLGEEVYSLRANS
jgi:hypothetical protein